MTSVLGIAQLGLGCLAYRSIGIGSALNSPPSPIFCQGRHRLDPSWSYPKPDLCSPPSCLPRDAPSYLGLGMAVLGLGTALPQALSPSWQPSSILPYPALVAMPGATAGFLLSGNKIPTKVPKAMLTLLEVPNKSVFNLSLGLASFPREAGFPEDGHCGHSP